MLQKVKTFTDSYSHDEKKRKHIVSYTLYCKMADDRATLPAIFSIRSSHLVALACHGKSKLTRVPLFSFTSNLFQTASLSLEMPLPNVFVAQIQQMK